MPPCVLFEDEHLLVVNKPPGMNTHSPAPYAGEGIYDWLRHREPRWAGLATIHRLDKETSGVLVFSKTQAANRSLTDQFARRLVRKRYVLLTDRPAPDKPLRVKSAIARAGAKYISRPAHSGGELAETIFCSMSTRSRITPADMAHCDAAEAEPLTGRTHQIRVHAAAEGFPILGDTLYGGTPSWRVFLHAASIAFRHPTTGEQQTFNAPVEFERTAPDALRRATIEEESTNAYRLLHGASDGSAGWYVDRLGEFLLSQSASPLTRLQQQHLASMMKLIPAQGAYHKILTRELQRRAAHELGPQPVLGSHAREPLVVKENGVQFELSLKQGYSAGLFFDQRENRRRLLTGHVAANFPLWSGQAGRKATVLNAFAYTCGFSVCAALNGAQVTSLDLSKKYLEWGNRNFALNGLDVAQHEFVYGDVLDWLPRLTKKGRAFDLILLDPPTFSQSKETGVFRVEADFGRLVRGALPLLKPGGVLFASTNAATWPPESFIQCVTQGITAASRRILTKHYAPQPPDFPISREEPAYLKTVWLRVD